MKFILLRHGEATHNVGFHTEGGSAFSNEKYRDSSLTEKGIQQAKDVAKKLGKEGMCLGIWCSPLTRALQTAEEVFEEVNLARDILVLHDNLLECLGGQHVCNERKARYEIKQKFPLWDTTFLSEMPPAWFQRENMTSLRSRIEMLLLYLTHLYKSVPSNAYVLIVTHKDLIFSLTGKDLENAEYTMYET